MLVTFLNSQPLANLANSAESYWGPLSEGTASGIPRLVNTDLRALIVLDEERDGK